jgi:hypothetical protein
MLVSVVIIGGMIVCATPFVPLGWRVDGTAWAVILPLAYGILCLAGGEWLIPFIQYRHWLSYPVSCKFPPSLTRFPGYCSPCQ